MLVGHQQLHLTGGIIHCKFCLREFQFVGVEYAFNALDGVVEFGDGLVFFRIAFGELGQLPILFCDISELFLDFRCKIVAQLLQFATELLFYIFLLGSEVANHRSKLSLTLSNLAFHVFNDLVHSFLLLGLINGSHPEVLRFLVHFIAEVGAFLSRL